MMVCQFTPQVTLASLAGKKVEEFRNLIPYKMMEAPWFYNGTLEQGKRVNIMIF